MLKRLAQEGGWFQFTKPGHKAKDCISKAKRFGCGGQHARSVCNRLWLTSSPVQRIQGETSDVLPTGGAIPHQASTLLLQTFRSWVVTDEKSVYEHGIIDDGSQATFIIEDLAEKLNLKAAGQRSCN